MNIGIIGAGFTGLAAAYQLLKSGHQVALLEKESLPGGLAIGFQPPTWKWALEKHYHHLFTSDWSIRNLAAQIHHPIPFYRPTTSVYYQGQIHPFDSPGSFLNFPAFSALDKARTAATLLYLRSTPWWQPLEKITAKKFIRASMGENSWRVLWEPLFTGKFHHYADQISAAWFWGRIKKRSPSLGYPDGGFQALAQSLASAITAAGGRIHFGTSVTSINPRKNKLSLTTTDRTYSFDKIICTLPSRFLTPLLPSSQAAYTKHLSGLRGLGAVNLVLALNHTFLPNTYWLNINDPAPFLAVVEHTNLISRDHYGGDHVVYVGNYVPEGHPYFAASPQQLVKRFLPALSKINPKFKSSWISQAWCFKAPFAQPVVGVGHSRLIPPFTTPIPNLFLANMEQVYPWDRGTNYAVELGLKAADDVLS